MTTMLIQMVCHRSVKLKLKLKNVVLILFQSYINEPESFIVNLSTQTKLIKYLIQREWLYILHFKTFYYSFFCKYN